MYASMCLGLPVKDFPVLENGEQNMDGLRRWIANRKMEEATKFGKICEVDEDGTDEDKIPRKKART